MAETTLVTRKLRSMTEGTISSDSTDDDSLSLEMAQLHEERSFGRLDQIAGTRPRRLCTDSSVGLDGSGVFDNDVQLRGRLTRSVSLPANLNGLMMLESVLSPNADQHRNEGPCRSIFVIAENESTSLPLSSDGGIIDDSLDDSRESDSSVLTEIDEQVVVPVEATTTTNQPLAIDQLTDSIDCEMWLDVERLCEEEPDAARQEISMLCQGEKCMALSLHLACSRRETPLSVVDALVTAYPASVMQPDQRRGRLAIHMATLKGASPSVVRYLARAVPKSLQVQDAEGNLPIHYAAMCGTNQIVDILLQANADACRVMNGRSKLPLHVLCARWVDGSENPVSIDLLKAMVNACPDSISTCDQKGRLPLHIACNMANPRLDVIRLLLSYKPETILVRDEDKCTPLQLAMRFCCAPDNDLCVAFLRDVTSHERQRQKRKSAKRMARRLLYLGRSSNKTPVAKPIKC